MYSGVAHINYNYVIQAVNKLYLCQQNFVIKNLKWKLLVEKSIQPNKAFPKQ